MEPCSGRRTSALCTVPYSPSKTIVQGGGAPMSQVRTPRVADGKSLARVLRPEPPGLAFEPEPLYLCLNTPLVAGSGKGQNSSAGALVLPAPATMILSQDQSIDS